MSAEQKRQASRGKGNLQFWRRTAIRKVTMRLSKFKRAPLFPTPGRLSGAVFQHLKTRSKIGPCRNLSDHLVGRAATALRGGQCLLATHCGHSHSFAFDPSSALRRLFANALLRAGRSGIRPATLEQMHAFGLQVRPA